MVWYDVMLMDTLGFFLFFSFSFFLWDSYGDYGYVWGYDMYGITMVAFFFIFLLVLYVVCGMSCEDGSITIVPSI